MEKKELPVELALLKKVFTYLSNIPSLTWYHIIFLVILLVNLPVGKIFIGWDAVSPELNFPLNFARFLSSTWQENYGLGVVAGHGFASLLPHTIVTFLFSLFLPDTMVRSVYTLFCYYLGGLGMFFLTSNLTTIIKEFKIRNHHIFSPAQFRPLVSLLTACFYLWNMATIQIFYLQLEPFVIHFASLPWLFWIILQLIEKPTRIRVTLFILINIFASTQGFIPSVFVAYMLGLSIFLGVYFLQTRTVKSFATASIIIFLTLLINAYWLLPLMYYQVFHNTTFLSAYNNLISTPHFIDVNKKFGSLSHVILLQSFLLESFQLGDFVLKPWLVHQSNFFIRTLGFGFFGIILCGIGSVFLSTKKRLAIALLVVFGFFFMSLATNAFPFSILTGILQSLSSTYEQAFRTAFTKFSIGVAFSYSIFFSFGLVFILSTLTYWQKYRKQTTIFLGVIITSLLLYGLPLFQGNLVYNKLLISIPQAYTDIISYFKTQGDGRIADFPQNCSEGWFAYNWGYFGSGFYWYGIKQPILARSFDVWGNTNENYYWEVLHALQTQDYSNVDNVLKKYDVRWVLFDPNISSCKDQKNFVVHQDFQKYLENSGQYTLVNEFSSGVSIPVQLYTMNGSRDSYLSVSSKLPRIAPTYSWNDNDIAYQTHGSYISAKNDYPDVLYPFNSLFTKRKAEEAEFIFHENTDSLQFSNTLPPLKTANLTIPSLLPLEKNIPISLILKPVPTSRTIQAILRMHTPQVTIDDKLITSSDVSEIIGSVPLGSKTTLFINGEKIIPIKSNPQQYEATLSLTIPNTIQLYDDVTNRLLFSWNSATETTFSKIIQAETAISLPESNQPRNITVIVKKAHDTKVSGITKRLAGNNIHPYICDNPSAQSTQFEEGFDEKNYIRLLSTNQKQCIKITFPDTPTSLGYFLDISTRHKKGNNLKFSVQSKDSVVNNEEYIYASSSFRNYRYIIPPTFSSELGYSVILQNISESNNETVNDIADVTLWQIPYNVLKHITINTSSPITQASVTAIKSSHPIETSYNGTIPASEQAQTLILSQAYDPGWKLYTFSKDSLSFIDKLFPFLEGESNPDHVLINNWSNGWNLTPDSKPKQSILIFLPQYLAYGGFVLLLLSFLSIVIFPYLYARFISNLTKK